jgi:hypothetical protein
LSRTTRLPPMSRLRTTRSPDRCGPAGQVPALRVLLDLAAKHHRVRPSEDGRVAYWSTSQPCLAYLLRIRSRL